MKKNRGMRAPNHRLPLILFLPLLLQVSAPVSAQLSLDEGLQKIATDLATILEGGEIRKIAVVEFQDINGYPSAMGPFVVEELVTQLFIVRPGQFEIVERRQLAKVLQEQKLTSTGLFDEETISEIGKILGIQAIVTGSITDLGSSVRINTRAVAVETARVFAAASATVTADEVVQNLLRQPASPRAGAGTGARGGGSGAGPTTQPADVYFQNDFLRVTVSTIGVKLDDRDRDAYVTLSLVFENLTGSELRIADSSSCTLQLIDDRGVMYKVRDLAGLHCVSPGRAEAADYSSIGPSSRTTVVGRFLGLTENPGSRFALGGNLVRLVGNQYSSFSLGISGIQGPDPEAVAAE